jgi:hypothetical protein
VFVRLKPMFGHYPPLAYSYLFGTPGFALGKVWRPLSYAPYAVFPTAWLTDYRWIIFDTFYAVATTYQSGHTPTEIDRWLREAGFVSVRQVAGDDFVATK